MSLHLSKCHIVGNHMSWLKCVFQTRGVRLYSWTIEYDFHLPLQEGNLTLVNVNVDLVVFTRIAGTS